MFSYLLCAVCVHVAFSLFFIRTAVIFACLYFPIVSFVLAVYYTACKTSIIDIPFLL